ncbi:MAG: hypothetical protein QOG68_628 [Solirubrobacteraceae bacterium]|nr:hypothetical protein [Solirubrobacteraceae bacterium]
MSIHGPDPVTLSVEQRSDITLALSELAQRPSVPYTLEAVRVCLGMEVAYLGEIVRNELTIHALDGDATSFSIAVGMSLPLEQTFCRRVLAGRLPNLIPDVAGDERAASVPMTAWAGIGAFVSMPVRLSDGRLYGTLCAASHHAMPSLGYGDLHFMHVVARIVGDQLDREARQARDSDRDDCDLYAMATALRSDALELLETATRQGGPSTMLIGRMQQVANELGSLERLLQPGVHFDASVPAR